MPYIISLLALVILGTGYMLFQKTPLSTESTDSAVTTVTLANTSESTTTEHTIDTSNVRVDGDEDHKEPEKMTTPYDDNPPVQDSNEQSGVSTDVNPPKPITNDSAYTNGTYYTKKSYRTPDGTYQMNVSMEVNDGRVTASVLSFDIDGARDGYSKRFASAYQSQVLGKDLDGLTISRIGGASLTTDAFNSALSSIRSQVI